MSVKKVLKRMAAEGPQKNAYSENKGALAKLIEKNTKAELAKKKKK
jgi:hypothetical protein